MGDNGSSEEEKLRQEVEELVVDSEIDWDADEDDEVEDGS